MSIERVQEFRQLLMLMVLELGFLIECAEADPSRTTENGYRTHH